MPIETQTFLDEAKSHRAHDDVLDPLTPDLVSAQTAVCTVPYLNQGARAWWKRAGQAMEEMARQERLLLDAIATEADTSLRAKLEEQLRHVRTVLRVGSEIQRQARDLQQTYQQWVELDKELRTLAQPLGYVI